MIRPVCVIPRQNDFLEELKGIICEECENRPERAVVVFPHSRPKRYLTEAFRRDEGLPRPLLLPRMLTIKELFAHCLAQLPLAPARPLGLLDAAALLRGCVQRLAAENPAGAALRALDAAAFFPWGVRLFALLEECLNQGVMPVDIAHAEAEVAPLPAAILSMLSGIHRNFTALLRERGLTTPGLDAFHVADNLEKLPPLFPGRLLSLAGFGALNGTEYALIRRLLERGALLCLHSDPALAERGGGAEPHWSCAEHAALLRRLPERAARAELRGTPENHSPELHFFAGYDLHSQLQAFAEEVGREGAGSIAVVPADPALLLPVLHHLPDKNVNISMGYPLDRSPLWRLIEILFRVREARREDGRYHWRGLLEFLRHPYPRALQAGEERLWGALQKLEERLLEGGRFADPRTLLEGLELESETEALCRLLVERGLYALERAHTPRELARALEEFCRLLAERTQGFARDYPIDAECLVRLLDHVLPALCDFEEADTAFPPNFLHALARECVRAERVAFEADPISGLQVLGMLETRLLRFDRIFILDATDDLVPGTPRRDPLLPDALRAALELPHTGRRDHMVAHTLYGLLAGAREARFFWQEGVQRTALFEGKKERSRFAEDLLWQREKKEGRLFGPASTPVRRAAPVFVPPRLERQGITRSPELDAALRALLETPLSAGRLNSYLRCPLRFAWEHICRIRPAKEVREGEDPAAVGDFIHKVLLELFKPRLNRIVRRGEIRVEELRARFDEELAASGLRESLPADGCTMLEVAGFARLRRFLDRQPEETRILALERPYSRPFTGKGIACTLRGTVDRLDLRADELLVLDYKTGALNSGDSGIFHDPAFWERLEAWDGDPENDPLPELAERLPDLQLPCYIYLCAGDTAASSGVCNAAWVELREDGKERLFFEAGASPEAHARRLGRIETAFGAILFHMLHSPHFSPNGGRHCDWCPYSGSCSRRID